MSGKARLRREGRHLWAASPSWPGRNRNGGPVVRLYDLLPASVFSHQKGRKSRGHVDGLATKVEQGRRPAEVKPRVARRTTQGPTQQEVSARSGAAARPLYAMGWASTMGRLTMCRQSAGALTPADRIPTFASLPRAGIVPNEHRGKPRRRDTPQRAWPFHGLTTSRRCVVGQNGSARPDPRVRPFYSAPLLERESGEARNSTTSAISSGMSAA